MLSTKTNKKTVKKSFVFAGGFFVCLIFLNFSFFIFHSFAAPDQELTYHGKLTDALGVAVTDGTYDFTLTIYDQPTGGTCLWTARGNCTTPTSKTLTVSKGIFSTTLGETGDNPLNIDFSQNYYLSVTIGTNSEMSPRRKITPTGFALNAHRLNGLTSDNYIDTSNVSQTKQGALAVNGNFTVNSNNLFVNSSNGRVGIGTNTPGFKLDIKTTQTSGTIVDIGNSSLVTLAGPLIGQSIDLATNYSISYQSVTGHEILIGGNTSTSSGTQNAIGQSISMGNYGRNMIGGTTNVRGVSVDLGGLYYQTGGSAGTITGDGYRVIGTTIVSDASGRNVRFNGLSVTNPTVTQTGGSSVASGVSVTTSTITTNGTQNGINVNAVGVGAGNLYGIAISGITPGAGSETALNIGGGWDYGIYSSTTNNSYFAGAIGIGTTSPSAKLHTISTTEQLRIGYDTSNYFSTTIGSAGSVTFNANGTGQGFVFSDELSIAGNILPSTDNTYTLGDSTHRWQDVYVGPNSLHIGSDGNDVTLSYNATTNSIEFSKPTTITGSIKLTNDTSTCDNTKEGAMRYNSTAKVMEFCNGMSWGSLDGGTLTTGGGWISSGAQVYSGNVPASWIDLDLSGIVGNQRTLVLIQGVNGTGTNSQVDFRTNGETTNVNPSSSVGHCFGSATNTMCEVIVETDDNGIVEILGIANGNWTLTLKGYVGQQASGTGSLWTQNGTSIGYTTGNVGIGTTNPTFQLSVNSPENSGESRLLLQLTAEQTGRRPRLNIASHNTQTGEKYFGFQTDADDGVFPHMILQSVGGNVGIGVTNPSSKLVVNSSASQTPFVLRGGGNVGVEIMRILDASGNEKMRMDNNGNVGIGTNNPTQLLTVHNGTTTGTYTTSGWIHSSDERLKTNVNPIDDPLKKVLQLEDVYFNWNTDPTGNRQIGFIAQDVQKIIPEVVVGSDKDGYGISYGNLTALLVGAVQEQHTLIQTNTNDLTTKAKAETVAQLQTLVDTQFTEVSEILKNVQDDILALQEDANTQADLIAQLQKDIVTQEQYNALKNLVGAHQEVILAINEHMLFAKNDDDMLVVTIAGITTVDVLKAKAVHTEKFAVNDAIKEERDGKETSAASIGTAIILAGQKSVTVETAAVEEESRIFVSPKKPLNQTVAATKIKARESFVIELLTEIEEDMEIDWFIIGQAQ